MCIICQKINVFFASLSITGGARVCTKLQKVENHLKYPKLNMNSPRNKLEANRGCFGVVREKMRMRGGVYVTKTPKDTVLPPLPPLGGPRWGVIDQFCSWWSIWYLAPPKNGWNGQIPFNVIVSASLNIFLAIWWVFNSNYAWATLCKSHNLENSSSLVIFFSKSGVRQKGLVTFSFWSFENLKLSKVKKKIFSRKKKFFFVFFLFFRT